MATASTRIVAVSGNPRPASRTSALAERVALEVARVLGAPAPSLIELSELAPELFSAGSPAVARARRTVADADVVVVATPTYKATYTGLLKAFLDTYGNNGLAGVTAVAVQVAGNPAHLLAAEVHLRPLLVELGATVPTRAVALSEGQLADVDALVSAWGESQGAALRRAVGAGNGLGADALSETDVVDVVETDRSVA